MVLGDKRLLVILLSFVVAATVGAAPTMSDYNKSFASVGVLPASGVLVSYIPETSQIGELSNSQMAAIGAEILKPPPDYTYLVPAETHTLPPVPAATFMVIGGFLCISLVKDRKLWLAAPAGLLWAGQAGIHVIPQLVAHISKQQHIQRQSPANTACLHWLEDSCRLRSNIEGTQYIGLLHHLAGIPDTMTSLPSKASLLRRTMSLLSHVSVVQNKLQKRNAYEAPKFTKVRFLFLIIPAVICTVPRTVRSIRFSPAFIFDNLSRGPPISALALTLATLLM